MSDKAYHLQCTLTKDAGTKVHSLKRCVRYFTSRKHEQHPTTLKVMVWWSVSTRRVERFNKTLVTMLSAYVNDHHSDWDEHLPYVMMAWKRIVNTTRHNVRDAKISPIHTKRQMGLEIERKHRYCSTFVREYMKTAMVGQKKYHDQK